MYERARWPQNTVPYEIDYSEYSENDINLIRQAMSTIESKTCIMFVEHTNQEHYIKILVGQRAYKILLLSNNNKVLSSIARYMAVHLRWECLNDITCKMCF